MKLSELPSPTLNYGDRVKIKDKNSRYTGIEGKVISVSPSSVAVRFEGIKKPVTIMPNALERI